MSFKNYYGKTIENTQTQSYDNPLLEDVLSIAQRTKYKGYINSSNTLVFTQSTSGYEYCLINVNGGETVECDTYGFWCELSSFENGVPTVLIRHSSVIGASLTLDANTRILFINTSQGSDTTPTSFKINGIEYARSIRDEVRSDKYDNGVNWVQFGDSITSGYYSFFKEDGTADSRASGYNVVYPYLVSRLNHWNYTNKGVGGFGWIMSGSGITQYIAYNRVKEVDFTQYNLVTFAYGINDWKAGNKPLGSIEDTFTYDEDMIPTTVVGSMRYCFNYVMSKNPNIKIIVITPFTCRGYNYEFGDDSTNWARGYKGFQHGKSLDEFTELMKQVCDEYDVEVIDMTTSSCINKANIVQLLPDGVHPSIECHELLAREIASKIQFK